VEYLAANALGRAVYSEVFDGRTGPPSHPRYVFLDDRSRNFFDDWPAVAHDTARILRSEAGRDLHDPGPAELIEELSQTSAEFRAVWSQHDVRLPAAGLPRFHHPLVGQLDLVFEAAELRADPGLTLLLATAVEGSTTEAELHQLSAMTSQGFAFSAFATSQADDLLEAPAGAGDTLGGRRGPRGQGRVRTGSASARRGRRTSRPHADPLRVAALRNKHCRGFPARRPP
jgi:MmyB-like transcription regulator ligand binding domain